MILSAACRTADVPRFLQQVGAQTLAASRGHWGPVQGRPCGAVLLCHEVEHNVAALAKVMKA